MPVCPDLPHGVTPAAEDQADLGLLGGAGMVAVRVADLASPTGAGLGKDGRTALVTAGTGRIRSADVVVFCKPVAAARAVVRRDGRVQAAGHPADHARLGRAGDRLDALAGTAGVIDQVAGAAELTGKVNGKARRAMTAALAIRFTLLMTLIPEADYPAVMDALLGDLALVPWQRPFRVPTATAAPTWREALGPAPLEELRDMVLAGIDAGHREHDYRAVRAGNLDVGPIDGPLTRVPDTPGNREAFRSSVARPTAPRPAPSCGNCGSPTLPPAQPWPWPQGRRAPRPARRGRKARPGRSCWTKPWTATRPYPPATACG